LPSHQATISYFQKEREKGGTTRGTAANTTSEKNFKDRFFAISIIFSEGDNLFLVDQHGEMKESKRTRPVCKVAFTRVFLSSIVDDALPVALQRGSSFLLQQSRSG
jgi:hypothetical protein